MDPSTSDKPNLEKDLTAIGKKVTEQLKLHKLEACLAEDGFNMSEEDRKDLLLKMGPEEVNVFDRIAVFEMVKKHAERKQAARDEMRSKAREACKKFDKNGSGVLNETDLVVALSTAKISMNSDQKIRAIKKCLASGSAGLNYTDFIDKYLFE